VDNIDIKGKEMISIKSYTVALDDGTTGAFSTCFLNARDQIGKKINIRTQGRKWQRD
jgi:hypothetical protein